jgi:phosphoglycerate dehydrogenase-like enzyme
MKLVVYPPVDEERLARLGAVARGAVVVNAIDEAAAIREIADADGFLGKITAPILTAAERLRWVQSFTASLEHYMFPALARHGCVLTNMRGLFSDVIADQVMGYVLCFARNLHVYIRNQLSGTWAPVGGETARVSLAAGPAAVTPIDLAHRNVADQTLGVVGFGAIGEEVARRAKAFGMRVVAIDARRTEPTWDVDWVRPPERLDDLLAESDYVVIAAPQTPATVKMFGAAQFRRMRPTAYLINVGRGAIVDLAALTNALSSGTIAGAALDVFEVEPLPADHPLWRMPNVVLTPHVAGYSPRIAERHLALLVENVRRFVAGESLLNVVDKDAWF